MGMRSLFVTALVAAGCAAVAVACSSFSSDGGAVDGADASTDGGTGSAESGQGDSGGGGGSDGSTSPDADGGLAAADPGVFCGTGPFCDPQIQVCCKDLPAGAGEGCLPKAAAPTCQGTTLGCDDGADCAFMTGGVCCGELGSNDIDLLQSNCYTLNNCKTTSFWVVVCDPSASTACPGGVPCNVPDGGGFGFCEGLVHP